MISEEALPRVTFVIPTYNASATIDICLQSVIAQNYPVNLVEVLIVDGGSTDSTLEKAHRFPCKYLNNPYRYEDGPQGGKSIGFRSASGEIVVFLDSDNELASPQWLVRTVLPYRRSRDIVGTFPRIVPRSDGTALSRYLTRANPLPVVRFWQPDDVVVVDRQGEEFRIVRLRAACDLSNGASVRRDILFQLGGYDYGYETTKRLIDAGYAMFAWPNGTDVFHHFARFTLRRLVKKRVARLRRFRAWEGEGLRDHTVSVYRPRAGDDYLRLGARTLKSLLFLTIPEAVWRGVRDRDWAWLYHPLVSFLETNLHIIFLWDLALRSLSLGCESKRT